MTIKNSTSRIGRKWRSAAAIHELRNTEAVTTPRQVDALQAHFTEIASGESEQLLGMTGRCADRLRIGRDMHSLRDLGQATVEMAGGVLLERAVVETSGNYSHITRGNYAKPRSDEYEHHPDGHTEPSWQGDITNGKDIDERQPDPTRMVAAALQSRDVMDTMTAMAGEHVPTAHELLLLPYEIGMLREDPESGRLYSLSADMLWVGVRTNDPESPQVTLASMIANPVGVKLGPNTTPELVAALKAKLNPDSIPGRLTFMIRMGLDNTETMAATLAAIAEYAPESIIMYDPHGSTEKVDGVKVRTVSKIIDEIKLLADLCHQHHLPLHGALLETTPDYNRQECLNEPDEMPPANLDIPDVDPLLNPEQFSHIYSEIAPVLGRRALLTAVVR